MNKPRIIDCFTFYNELELLNYRLQLLYKHVDYFVLVEANQTHMGNPKPLYFEANKELFSEFLDKIIHVIVDLPIPNDQIDVKQGNQWTNEKFQRSSIIQGIKTIHMIKPLRGSDLCIISDLDEIINPQLLQNFNQIPAYPGYILEQQLYYYNLNSLHKENWTLAKMVTVQEIINLNSNPDLVRHRQYPIIKNAGWHLSYFGDIKHIQNKIQQFTHQEFNTDNITDVNNLQARVDAGQDIYGRNYVQIQKVDETQLPLLATTYLKNYIGSLSNQTFDKPINVRLEITMCTGWQSIVQKILFQINNSGLYRYIDKIYCVCDENFTNNEVLTNMLSKYDKITYINEDTDVKERYLNNSYILYLNTEYFAHNGYAICKTLLYDFENAIKNINISADVDVGWKKI